MEICQINLNIQEITKMFLVKIFICNCIFISLSKTEEDNLLQSEEIEKLKNWNNWKKNLKLEKNIVTPYA